MKVIMPSMSNIWTAYLYWHRYNYENFLDEQERHQNIIAFYFIVKLDLQMIKWFLNSLE